MELRVYPDPILTQVSDPVTEFDESLESFCNDLHNTMTQSNGVGLSAIQVGLPKRIIVMQCPIDVLGRFGPKYTFINPEIIEHLEDTFAYSEGCLSVPGYYENRERYNTIVLRYQDLEGETRDRVFHALEAFCIQHELDHLEGKLFIDDLSPLKRDRIRKKIEKTLRR